MIESKNKDGLLSFENLIIAVFLDYRNQEKGINDLYNNQHFDFKYIYKYVHSFGEIKIAKAYGPFDFYKIGGKRLVEYGFELIDTCRMGNKYKKKDNTDPKMTLDITATFYSHSEINLYVLITGDIDFLDAVLEIKKNQSNKVFIISEKNALNHRYFKNVDKVIYYQDLRRIFKIY